MPIELSFLVNMFLKANKDNVIIVEVIGGRKRENGFISSISELPSSQEIEVSVPANHSKFWYHGGKSMEVNKTADKYRVLSPFLYPFISDQSCNIL